MSRIRRLGFAAIMMVTMLVGGAPAFATEPLTTSGHVTDPDGFLSDEQRETIETPAKSFYSTYTTYIDVAVIPNFSGQKPLAWCEATLEQSRSAQKGILYVVAYEDGTNVSCAGSELAKDSMTRLMLDGALSAARYKHKTTPLTPEEAVRALASSSTLYAAITTSGHAELPRTARDGKRKRKGARRKRRKNKRGISSLTSSYSYSL